MGKLGQLMTWQRDMETNGLTRLDAVRLPDRGPWDPPKHRLEIIGDMTQHRSR